MRCARPKVVFPIRGGSAAIGFFLVCCLSAVGCSGTGGGGAATEPAKATVAAFLEAIKRGDDAAAGGLLTTVARAKTKEMGISVAPPVADTAIATIRECEMVSESDDLAHVATVWIDTDPDGFRTEQNVVWVVRLDPEGWRVAGMAVKVFDDMAPLLLNFEDPEDMLAKQEEVALELQRRATKKPVKPEAGSPVAPQTARGGTPAATVR